MIVDKSKIVIAQFYTENVLYGPIAEEINKKYCEQHGYTYFVEKNTTKINAELRGRSPTWYKPKLIQDVIETLNPEYILFLDIDAVVVDFDQSIEQFIDTQYNLIFTEDYSNHSAVNAGVFLLKNCPWSHEFMNVWWYAGDLLKGGEVPELNLTPEDNRAVGFFKTRLWHDQSCLSILYKNIETVKNNIKIIEQHKLNWREPFSNNFIFHAFAFGHLPYRTLDTVRDKLFNKNSISTIPTPKKIKSSKKSKKIVIYHCYLINDWEDIVRKQLKRLKAAGLYDAADKLFITVIYNTEQNKKLFSKLIKSFDKFEVKFIEENAFEYEGIKKVHEIASTYENAKIFYFHTKGVSNKYRRIDKPDEISEIKVTGIKAWTAALEHFLIDNWKECVEKLDEYDSVGVTCNNGWHWGNFWWAHARYIKNNPAPIKGDRWYFEAWLHDNKQNQHTPKVYEFYKFKINPYRSILDKKFYDGTYAGKNSDLQIIEARYETFDIQVDEGRPPNDEIKYNDVTELIKLRYKTNKSLNGIHIINEAMGGDPLWGVYKQLRIRFRVKGFKEMHDIVFDENETTYFNLI